MHERASTRPRIISPLQLFALVTIAGAIFLNTARYIDLFSNTPEPEEVASIAEVPPAPNKPSVRVVARAEMQSTKPESATTQVRVQPPDELPALENATTAVTAAKNKKPLRAQAKALPLKQGAARLIFTAPPLPVPAPKRTKSISKSGAPPLPTRAPKEVRSLAGNALQQAGRASWYTLDSLTASGEKMDDIALTAAHNSLPFGTKVLIENIANGRSVVVRINDRGPFVGGRIIDLSKAAAEALEMIADGVADVRLRVIYDAVASADSE
jgi:rare lipoprotein A